MQAQLQTLQQRADSARQQLVSLDAEQQKVSADVALVRASFEQLLPEAILAAPRNDQPASLTDELAHSARLTMIAEMAASLAHELSQPLTAIATYAQAGVRLVRGGATDKEELLHTFEQVLTQATHAAQYVRRLREFMAHRAAERETVALNDLIRGALVLVQPELRDAAIEVELKLAEGLPAIQVDRMQIQQVILNLIRNAIDALREAPATPRALTISSSGVGTEVEVAVSDLGVGITVDMVQRLFRPYQSSKPHGMGMGLALCRSILQAHAGRFWVKPNPERGTTFFFTLPTATGKQQHGTSAVRLPRG